MTTHILKHGYSLCRMPSWFRPDIPGNWPEGHIWVSFQDSKVLEIADCDECLKRMPPEKLEIFCPTCGKQHLDVGEFATKVHRTHLCEETPDGPKTGCGHLWRPKSTPTFGVEEPKRSQEESELPGLDTDLADERV